LPDLKTVAAMQDTIDKSQSRITKLQQSYDGDVTTFVEEATTQLQHAREVIEPLRSTDTVEALSYYINATAKVQKILDFIRDFQTLPPNLQWQDDSVQILPIAVYPESKVSERSVSRVLETVKSEPVVAHRAAHFHLDGARVVPDDVSFTPTPE
jgi:cell fate (sporulation/competence/biofilm development) regulator YmcA (YheA/YmcA/DUF963 family)